MLNVVRSARGAALPASVLLVGWTLGGALYVWMDRDRVHDDASHRDSIIAGVESDLRTRLAMYENALRAAAGDMAASDHLKNPADWHTFVNHLGLLTRYPGVEVMSVVQPVPHAQLQHFIAAQRSKGSPDFSLRTMFGAPPPALPPSEHMLIVCAEPPAVAARALGDDMASEPARRAAAERARDSGEPAFSRNTQIGRTGPTRPSKPPETRDPPAESGSVVRASSLEARTAQLGLQVFVPVYRDGLPLTTVEQRGAALSAWVTAVFVADTFF